MDALIGHTGFVGSSLLRQHAFGKCYRSTNIHDICGEHFGMVVCAGVPAKKWIADRDPEADLENIKLLAAHINRLGNVDRFVLISTIDVYSTPAGVDEKTPIDAHRATPYGRNRRWLEEFVLNRFRSATVIRLPGLVGPGLRKNVIFDLHHNNNISAIDSRGVFQFYPMVNIWSDLLVAVNHKMTVVNFSTEPMSVTEVARLGFDIDFVQQLEDRTPASYDVHSSFAERFGGRGPYLYDQREIVLAIRAYAQSEQQIAPAI